MGPFFALGHALGLPDWVVQRLWLGLLLWLAAWGVVRLLDALHPARRGIVHLAAGAVTILNPFVVTYTNRTTVTLLAYAALPWLLLAVHRGLRASRGWRWPAACALLVTAAGGGVNGAVVAWMLVATVAPARLRSVVRRRRLGRRRPVRRPGRAPWRARVRLVDRPRLCPIEVRRRLPQVHRAARDRMGDDERHREPAADGLLALLCRDRVRRARDSVLRRCQDPAVLAAGGRRHPAVARGRAGVVRLRRGAGATDRSFSCSCSRACSSCSPAFPTARRSAMG